MKKLEYEFVKRFFEENQCKLLEPTYEGAFHKLKYTCSCGRESITTWARFNRGSRCIRCRDEKSANSQLLTQEFVSDFFTKQGCTLLCSYQGIEKSLDYICKCGRQSTILWNNFKRGSRCRKCSNESILGEKHPHWNPDREAVVLNKKIKARSYDMLKRLFESWGKKKEAKSAELLGYTTQELKSHLTNHPNWNKVKDQNWSIDHIFPVKAFIEHGITDLRLINCLENLQPMELSENISKNAKYSKPEFLKWLKTKSWTNYGSRL